MSRDPWRIPRLFLESLAGPSLGIPGLPGLLAGRLRTSGKPRDNDRYLQPHEVRTLAVLYQRNCSGCHGADGKLGPAPPLNDKLFLALIPDVDLERLITEGRPGTLMPAFASAKGGHLTSEQVKILAAGLKPRWGSVEPAPSGAPPYLVPRPSVAGSGIGKKEEGLKVFARPALLPRPEG